MGDLLKNVSGQITGFWSKFSRKRKITFIFLLALIVIISIIAVSLLNKTKYAVLYTNLSSQEAGEIYQKLTEGKYEVKTGANNTIYVPSDKEASIRMQLAAEGYPKDGLNYDIFKNSTGFGTTDFEKQKYLQFQLQDRLQNTIKTLDMVEDAIVTLTLPDNSSVVLKGDKQPSTASVLLKIRNNGMISSDQVKAIVELVAKSVPGLTQANISVIDGNMKILNRSTTSDNLGSADTQLDLQYQVGNRLQQQIQNLLEPVFGYGKVMTGVNVTLDFDKHSTETVKFEPVNGENGIVVSLNELSETAKGSGAGGAAGQDSNGSAPTYPTSGNGDDNYEKVSKTVNYEVNQTKELIEKAQGQIKDLSVSVIINEKDASDTLMSKVKEVVSGSVGIDQKLVVVQSMPFNGTSGLDDAFSSAKQASSQALKQQQTKDLVIYIFLGAFLALVIFVAFRMLKMPEQVQLASAAAATAAVKVPVTNMEAAMQAVTNAASPDDEIPDIPVDADRHTYKEQITKFYKKSPDTVVHLLRNWLNEE